MPLEPRIQLPAPVLPRLSGRGWPSGGMNIRTSARAIYSELQAKDRQVSIHNTRNTVHDSTQPYHYRSKIQQKRSGLLAKQSNWARDSEDDANRMSATDLR